MGPSGLPGAYRPPHCCGGALAGTTSDDPTPIDRKKVAAQEAEQSRAEVAIRALIDQARAGNVVACRELLDRVLGKPESIDLIAKMEELELLLEAHSRRSA